MFTHCTTICLRFVLPFVYHLHYRLFTFCTTVLLFVYLLYYRAKELPQCLVSVEFPSVRKRVVLPFIDVPPVGRMSARARLSGFPYLTAPLASVLPRVDDIEDLYESLSRLEKALAIHCSTPHSFVSPLVLYALMIDAGSTASCIHNYGPSAAYKHEVFNQVLPGSSPYADQRRATAEPRRSP